MSSKINKLLAVVLCVVMAMGSVAAVTEGSVPPENENIIPAADTDGTAVTDAAGGQEKSLPAAYAETLKNMDAAALLAKLNELLGETSVVLTAGQTAALKEGDFYAALRSLINTLLPAENPVGDAEFAALSAAADEAGFKAALIAAVTADKPAEEPKPGEESKPGEEPKPGEESKPGGEPKPGEGLKPGEESKPEAPKAPVCTCTAGEEEKAAEGFQHELTCPLNPLPLYEKLMACQKLADFHAIADSAVQADIDALTEEQMTALEAKESELRVLANPVINPEPVPEQPAAPVESEVRVPDYTWAAPFMPPVEGIARFRMMRTAAPEPEKDNGLELNKTAEYNPDTDMVHIVLDAYATGSKIVTDTTEQIPTDIILVLDQSGSMDWDMDKAGGYERYLADTRANENLYNNKDNVWFKTEDGKYIKVLITREEINIGETVEWKEVPAENRHNADNWRGRLGDGYWDLQGKGIYAKVGGEYKKVTVTYTGSSNAKYVYTYKLSDGTIIATSKKNEGKPDFSQTTDSPYLYTKHTSGGRTDYKYTYSYTKDGVTTEIGTSVGDSTNFEPNLWYISTAGTIKRIEALQQALNLFTGSVSNKAKGPDGVLGTKDDVKHRIAVVGFAYGSDDDYENTELFNGSTQIRYDNITENNYKNAFKDMSTTTGQSKVNDSIKALTAKGSTNTQLGLKMAQNILKYNPVPAGEKRNQVVIVFTDGAPTAHNGFHIDVANSAIANANSIKGTKEKPGATVYGVGIFEGADGKSAGKNPGGDLEKDEFNKGNTTQKGKDACNWFMQNVSSNNGTPQEPSYYLSASNQTGLDGIFENIAGQIESGGSASSLTAEAVIKDAVAPHFTLPKDAVITVKTVDSEGIGDDGKPIWNNSTRTPLEGAVITNDGNNNVSVKGFDYSANWVGKENNNGTITTHNGKKLVIEFDVKRKDTFLGGDHVYTNGDGYYANGGVGAHIYENDKPETKPLEAFPNPDVEVTMNSTIGTASEEIFLGDPAHLDTLSNEVMLKDGKLYVQRETIDNKDAYCLLDGMNNQYVDVTYNIYAENDPEHKGTPIGTVTIPAGQTAETATIKWNDPNHPNMPNPTDLSVGEYHFPVTVVLAPAYWDASQQPPAESEPDGALIVKVKAGNIHLKKIVTGSLGDETQPFNFTVTDANGNVLNMIGEDGRPIEGEIVLCHGDDRLVGTVNTGDVLTFTETCLDYEASAQVELNKAGAAKPAIETLTVTKDENGKAVFTYTLPNMAEYESIRIIVTNNREGTPDTGVALDSLPYILILVIVAAVVAVVIVKKNHRRDDE